MKKFLGFLLIIAMLMVGCTALAEGIPQPEAGKKFETNWAYQNSTVTIDYEDEGYKVTVETINRDAGTGTQNSYSCFYEADKDALVSNSSSKTDFTFDITGERNYADPAYDGLDEAGQESVFTINENGRLIWKSGRESGTDDVEYNKIGKFNGIWKNTEEEVEVHFNWVGGDPDTWYYDVEIHRGREDSGRYTVFLMKGEYDAETGKLSCKGNCTLYTANADGGFDASEDTEEYDAFFSEMDNGKILYETGNGIELEYSFTSDVSAG